MTAKLTARQAEGHELVTPILILVVMDVEQAVGSAGATPDLDEQVLEPITKTTTVIGESSDMHLKLTVGPVDVSQIAPAGEFLADPDQHIADDRIVLRQRPGVVVVTPGRVDGDPAVIFEHERDSIPRHPQQRSAFPDRPSSPAVGPTKRLSEP